MSDRTVRWGGVAAIVFVVLILVTVVSGGSPPAADDAASKIRDYFVDHRGGLLFANVLGLVAIPVLLWFGAVFREVVRGDETATALGTASLAGLLVTAPMAMVGGALQVSLIYDDGLVNKLGDDTVRVVWGAQALLFGATAAGLTLFSLTAGLAIHRTRALPGYTMWFAFLCTLGNIVAIFSVADAGAAGLSFIGLVTFALFLLVAGVTMALGKAKLTTASLMRAT